MTRIMARAKSGKFTSRGKTSTFKKPWISLAQENQGELDETLVEVTETVREAAKASLRDIKLMEEGHCPACGHKTLRQFLFTTVCSSCGWFSFISPEEGKSHIHLQKRARD